MDADDDRFVRFTFFDGQADGWPFLFTSPSMVEDAHGPKAKAVDTASPAATVVRPTSPLPLMAAPRDPKAVARIHISQLTPSLFETHYRSLGVPLVVEGALDNSIDWRLATFVDSLDTGATYQCRVHGADAFATQPSKWTGRSHARHVVPTTAQKFAETIRSGVAEREDCYVQADVRDTQAGRAMERDLKRIGAAAGLELHRQYGAIVNMWWGPVGHTEPLHMDATCGTLCQLRGRKRVVLFPAPCWPDLYPFPASKSGMSWAFSQVVQSNPDFAKFPRLRQALERRLVVELQEGEVLYIPAGCAHEISGARALADGSPADHVLSINRFWRTSPDLVRPHMPPDAQKSYDETMAQWA